MTNLNLQTIAALRALLETIDLLGQQLDDTPLAERRYRRASDLIDDLRGLVTAELAPLEQRLLAERGDSS